MDVPMVKENGFVLLSAGLLLEITRRKVCVLSVIFFAIAVVKSHQRVTFIFLSDVHLGKSHLSCCCKVGKLLILRDAQRKCSSLPLSPVHPPLLCRGCHCQSKTKHRWCWGSAFDVLLSVNVLSKLPGWIKCLTEPWHCSSRAPEELSPSQKQE